MEEKTVPENEPVKILFVWRSPSRPYQARDKEFYSTIIALAILASIVFFFIKEFLLVVVIWAGVFFIYALSHSPPEEVEHKITNHGLTTLNVSYLWDDLGFFWFTAKNDTTILHLATNRNLLKELTILIAGSDREKIKDILAKYLPFLENPRESWSDKASAFLTSKFSFAKPPKV